MSRHFLILMMLFAAAADAQDASTQQTDVAAKPEKPAQPAASAADGPTQAGDKTLSGISILGNQEAPKSLVIVPWKSSQIGAMPGLSRLLDDSVQPIDKEVFMRELNYYLIRSSAQ